MQFARRSLAFLVLWVVAVGVAAQPAPIGPLGRGVEPRHYRLDLRILPDESGFSGVAEIDVDLAATTGVMYLHGNGLQVTQVSLTMPDGVERAAVYEQVDPTGVARLTLAQPAPAGRGTLRFVYTAAFGRGGEGLYKSVVAGDAYAFTQFQPIDARRMFPGFDEPGFKTPFDIAVTTRAANAVIGNTPVRAEAAAGEALKRVEFLTTLPLPTYLIALAVGPLDIVEVDRQDLVNDR